MAIAFRRKKIYGGAVMARIAGIDLPKEKRTEIGLTYIYGIGRKSSNVLLQPVLRAYMKAGTRHK